MPHLHPTRGLRVGLAAAAAAALLGTTLTVPATAAAKPLQVATKIKITGVDGSDIDRVVFRGKVTSKRTVCLRNRTVKLRQVDQGLAAGKARTTRAGKWKIAFDGNRIDPGVFKATVTRKTVRQGGRKIICKPASHVLDVAGERRLRVL